MRANNVAGVLRRDRLSLVVGLGFISLLAWAYVISLAARMGGNGASMDMAMQDAMAAAQPWSGVDFALTFVMWAVMMVAMMTPSASPMVLTYGRVVQGRAGVSRPLAATSLFLLGYLLVWGAFSLLAAFVQWRLHEVAWLSPTLAATRPVLSGGLLIAAGAYQFTPLKRACLAHCRTPLGFLLTEWREGYRGAVVMGVRHGAFCAGCCWLLMALLFVGGVMDVLWVAAIAAYVLIEKLSPAGHWLVTASGLLALGAGAWLLAGSLL